MRIRARAIAAVVGTAAIVLGLSAPAGATTPKTNERMVFSFTGFSGDTLTGRAVASGVVNGVGTVTAGEGDVFPATVSLPQGELHLTVTSGPSQDTQNLATCAVAFRGTDTLEVTGGTGVFSGATGTGKDTVVGAIIFARNPDHTCNFDGPPSRVGITVIASLHLNLAPSSTS